MEETKPATNRKRKTAAKSPAAPTVPTRGTPTATETPRVKATVRQKSAVARTGGSTAPDADLYARIRMVAYLRAERRGFAPGREIDDWLAAEAEVMQRFEPSPAAPKKKAPSRKPRTG
jgi:hypothetical protein